MAWISRLPVILPVFGRFEVELWTTVRPPVYQALSSNRTVFVSIRSILRADGSPSFPCCHSNQGSETKIQPLVRQSPEVKNRTLLPRLPKAAAADQQHGRALQRCTTERRSLGHRILAPAFSDELNITIPAEHDIRSIPQS